jgi:hypothetical protein
MRDGRRRRRRRKKKEEERRKKKENPMLRSSLGPWKLIGEGGVARL